MTVMYNLHYTLSITHYHAPTNHWVVQGPDSLLPADYAPPPTQPRPRHVGLDTLLSIRSSCQGLGRAMYCHAKWTQRNW